MKHNTRYLIKTENGFKPFLGLQKINNKRGLVLIFDNCYLICTNDHRIKVDDEFKQASELKIHDKINGHEIIDIYPCVSTFYDVIGVQGNSYTCNGFEHHNCNVIVVDETAFVKTTLWNEFIDAIAPTQSALAWKKNIYLSTANGMNHFKDMCEQSQRLKEYKDLSEDTKIELKNGEIISISEYYRRKHGN